uniref:Uncharacterized protein n=1 Tax=Amphimedon queenslandica TaxID=400682 RepID=A0A1X7UHL9_AMPQE
MEAHHNETLRKQKTIEKKREKKEKPAPNSFEQNPGAGILLGCTTLYMDSYHRARCTTAKLNNRYRTHNYFQQY